MNQEEVKRVAALLNELSEITDTDKQELVYSLEGILYSDEDMHQVFNAIQELN
jgi:hypothetical protein